MTPIWERKESQKSSTQIVSSWFRKVLIENAGASWTCWNHSPCNLQGRSLSRKVPLSPFFFNQRSWESRGNPVRFYKTGAERFEIPKSKKVRGGIHKQQYYGITYACHWPQEVKTGSAKIIFLFLFPNMSFGSWMSELCVAIGNGSATGSQIDNAVISFPFKTWTGSRWTEFFLSKC